MCVVVHTWWLVKANFGVKFYYSCRVLFFCEKCPLIAFPLVTRSHGWSVKQQWNTKQQEQTRNKTLINFNLGAFSTKKEKIYLQYRIQSVNYGNVVHSDSIKKHIKSDSKYCKRLIDSFRKTCFCASLINEVPGTLFYTKQSVT